MERIMFLLLVLLWPVRGGYADKETDYTPAFIGEVLLECYTYPADERLECYDSLAEDLSKELRGVSAEDTDKSELAVVKKVDKKEVGGDTPVLEGVVDKKGEGVTTAAVVGDVDTLLRSDRISLGLLHVAAEDRCSLMIGGIILTRSGWSRGWLLVRGW